MSEVFDVDAIIDEADLNPFVFKLDGHEHELPHASSLTLEQQMLLAGGAEGDVGKDELRSLFDIIAPDVTDVVFGTYGFAALKIINAWTAHAGMEAGESSASTDSSPSTGRPSKPTSGTTTGNRSQRRSSAAKGR